MVQCMRRRIPNGKGKSMSKKCQNCRESEDCIWVEAPWTEKSDGRHSEEWLCEICYNHLNVKAGLKTVKGSQWKGEDDVEFNIYE